MCFVRCLFSAAAQPATQNHTSSRSSLKERNGHAQKIKDNKQSGKFPSYNRYQGSSSARVELVRGGGGGVGILVL